jgi:hypothetical protein
MDPFYKMSWDNKCHMAWPCVAHLGDVENIQLCQGIFFHVKEYVREFILQRGRNLLKIFLLVHKTLLATHAHMLVE